MFMFGITTFMFISGIIALVLVTTLMFQQMRTVAEFASGASTLLGASYFTSFLVWAIITRLMYIVCDIMCAWRTVVLWNRDKRVIAILLIFILGTIVAAVFSFDIGLEGELATLRPLDIIMVCPTLGTNLLSTGLIAWKAWQRRSWVRKHLFERSGFVRVDRVFALLIESGLIYCCIWIFYLISLFGVLPSPGFTLMALVSGLYPTLIVTLVGMQMSPVEHYSTHSTRMQFASGPALGQARDGSMPQPVVSIHREYTIDFDTQIPSTVIKASDVQQSLLP
ncbi:hypothetical protein EI94DRAFT_1832647 [Lactarius quietus]|nr:hypothetical protein EI94DRAFT_1832647 [Lactarius quietus]